MAPPAQWPLPRAPRIGILAGEMSGDLLGAGLMRELRRRCPDARFEGIGGPRMEAAGLASRVAMDRLSVMGLVEPLKRLPELLRIRRDLRQHFLADPPDVFIGIDSPDFCLSLEARLRRGGIPTVHYVSPSVWAWRRRRIHTIARAVDLMLCLFPFEAQFYEDHGVPVRCVGHPLADEFPLREAGTAARAELGLDAGDFVLALLPGSRQGEVSRLAPPFLDAARRCADAYPDLKVLLSAAGPQRREELEECLARECPELAVRVLTGDSRRLMAAADMLLLASGTVTLEALLLKKPMAVAYRMAPLSHAIISRLLQVPYFSLPNLLARRRIVPELLQKQVTGENLFEVVREKRDNPGQLIELKQSFQDIHKQLRKNASRQAADAVLELICQKNRG